MQENYPPGLSNNMNVMNDAAVMQGVPASNYVNQLYEPLRPVLPPLPPKAESWEQTRKKLSLADRRMFGSAASTTACESSDDERPRGHKRPGRSKPRRKVDTTNPNELTLEMLEDGIPAKQIAIIRQVLSPICTTIDPVPCYGDLSWFWENTEEGIKSLGKEIRLEHLAPIHIKALMRYILGPATQIFDP